MARGVVEVGVLIALAVIGTILCLVIWRADAAALEPLDVMHMEVDAQGHDTLVIEHVNVEIRSNPTYTRDGTGNLCMQRGCVSSMFLFENESSGNVILGHDHAFWRGWENVVLGAGHEIDGHGNLISGEGAKILSSHYCGTTGGEGVQIFQSKWAGTTAGLLTTVDRSDWGGAGGGYQNLLVRAPWGWHAGGNHGVARNASICTVVGGIGGRCSAPWGTALGGIQSTADERFETAIGVNAQMAELQGALDLALQRIEELTLRLDELEGARASEVPLQLNNAGALWDGWLTCDSESGVCSLLNN